MYSAAPAMPANAISIAPRGAAFVVTCTGAADVAEVYVISFVDALVDALVVALE
jgi:hypothetical protein